MKKRVLAAMAALDGATSKRDYLAAKLKVAGLESIDQTAMVDAIRACRARLMNAGVL